ncbi:hypothetical protein [Streptomyces hygroscopicus]|uniref:hypothetical protein n=1 Tax=Streptomyces hygroscopicus TaxID=1912 RepID=UPI000AF812DE|nr:hypothetical protein [Streptomyces hygroscopicus]GLV78444.1 hypothetical protein Shyhy02_64440 [Streptomyces hygroscopicus subsp. hygroscopicus]
MGVGDAVVGGGVGVRDAAVLRGAGGLSGARALPVAVLVVDVVVLVGGVVGVVGGVASLCGLGLVAVVLLGVAVLLGVVVGGAGLLCGLGLVAVVLLGVVGVARAVVLGGAAGGAALLCGSGLVGVVLFGVVVVAPVVGAVLAPVVGGEVVPVVGAAVVRGRRGSRRLGGPLRPGPLPPRRRTLSSPAVARSVVRTPSRMLLAPFSPARLNTGR